MIKNIFLILFSTLIFTNITSCGDSGSDEPNFDEIPEDIPEVDFYRVAADVKLQRDLAVARTGRHEFENFPLPIG